MSNAKAYYIIETENASEPTYRNVLVTTDHPLSSYGQPVVIDGESATPAQSFEYALNVRYEDRAGWPLVSKVNALSGLGFTGCGLNLTSSFSGLFGGAK